MKKALIVAACLMAVIFAHGQQLTYEFDYDNAGNRIRRAVVRLNNNVESDGMLTETGNPFLDMLSDGSTMSLYPNPTKDNIRFELGGDNKIERYSLTDITGRVIEKEYCNSQTLVLDMSKCQNGIYLLELFVEEKSFIYKVIKQ